MLTADTDVTIKSFETIGNRIATDMAQINVPRKHIIGSSLGASVASYVIGEYGLSVKATFIAPGGDLAACLWRGLRTQHLKEAFEAQGMTEVTLQQALQKLCPTYQAEQNIRDSSFKLYISSSDRVIDPWTNDAFIVALQSSGNSVKAHRNRWLGHYGTILRRSLVCTL